MTRAPLALCVGDPAGVGPTVSVVAAIEAARAGESIVVFGDAARLHEAARTLAPALAVERVDVRGPYTLSAGTLAFADAGAISDACITARAPTPEGGAAQLRALELAAASVRDGHARALVTGPTSKEAIVASGTPFIGQTEHLARTCGLPDDAVTMMFLGPTLRLALVTTHVAVSRVASELSAARVERAVRHLGDALLRLSETEGPPLPSRALGTLPSLVVAALNPHAGEHGMFGDEDQRIVEPGVALAVAHAPFVDGRVRCLGVRPAEAALREAAWGKIDGVVCMMHDQATIPSKLLDWGKAVNVTWGLPFLRTSVDHGVAYDAAARGVADADGMMAAVALAARMT